MDNKRQHKKKPRSANKLGRSSRARTHRNGGIARKGSARLHAARVYSSDLGAYIPRGVVLPKPMSLARAAEPIR